MGGRALGDGGRESDIVAMLGLLQDVKTAAATWAADIDIDYSGVYGSYWRYWSV